MNERQLKRLMPNASPSFIRANCDQDQDPSPTPELEQTLQHQPLGQVHGEKENSGKVLIRTYVARKRLLDEDDQCEKFMVDCARYAGLLPSDAPNKTTIERPKQRLCEKGEEEHTILEITYPL